MAARGSQVVMNPNPKGNFLSAVISGTPKPGTCMEIQTPFYQGGVHLWRVYQPGTDGEQRLVAVLVEDAEQGFTLDTAFVDGKMGKVYCPVPGDELNMLFGNAAGTGDDVAAGGILTVDTSTGKVIPTTGSPEMEPFVALEALVDPTADVHLPCMFTGK